MCAWSGHPGWGDPPLSCAQTPTEGPPHPEALHPEPLLRWGWGGVWEGGGYSWKFISWRGGCFASLFGEGFSRLRMGWVGFFFTLGGGSFVWGVFDGLFWF